MSTRVKHTFVTYFSKADMFIKKQNTSHIQFCQQLCRTGRSTVIIVTPLCNLYQQILSGFYICRIKAALYYYHSHSARKYVYIHTFFSSFLISILLFKPFPNKKLPCQNKGSIAIEHTICISEPLSKIPFKLQCAVQDKYINAYPNAKQS